MILNCSTEQYHYTIEISTVQTFRGDLNSSSNNFEPDLKLFLRPLASTVYFAKFLENPSYLLKLLTLLDQNTR